MGAPGRVSGFFRTEPLAFQVTRVQSDRARWIALNNDPRPRTLAAYLVKIRETPPMLITSARATYTNEAK
jgi:hypothetical protein